MIRSKTPDLIGVAFQSRKQVERYALFDLAPLHWLRGIALSLRIESKAFGNQFARTLPVILLTLAGQVLLSLFDAAAYLTTRLAQQINHLGGPRLLSGFLDEDQFAQVMGIAQRVLAFVVRVAGPAVMHGNAGKFRQNAEAVHSLLATLRMRGQPGERRRRCTMQPVKIACHAHTRFVKVHHGVPQQRLPDLSNCRLELKGGFVDTVLNGTGAQLHTEQIGHRLGCAIHRQLLVLRQIRRCCLDLGSVLHGLTYAFWKRCAMHLSACAPCLLDEMLGDFKPDRWQVNHLSRFGRNRHILARDRIAASVTQWSKQMDFDMIGLLDPLERTALVARLPSNLGLAALAQGLRLAMQSI